PRGHCHSYPLFFCTRPATPESYTLSLHDALPISPLEPRQTQSPARARSLGGRRPAPVGAETAIAPDRIARARPWPSWCGRTLRRSEEHTSELQSRRDLVCRLLLEKKKTEEDNKN